MSDPAVGAPALDPALDEVFDESNYLLRARVDIVAVLRDILRTRGLVTVHFGGPDTLLTPLLAIDTVAGEIVFDCSGAGRLNQGIMRAAKLLFFGAHDKVKVRFTTGPARLVEHAGAKAFAVRLPDALLRLQRREFYRVLAPIARPVRCVVPVETAEGSSRVEARLHDISQGGVALVTQPGELSQTLGARYDNCRIVLPDVGNVVVTLEVRNMTAMTLLNGRQAVRLGCRFVRPSMSALSLVHRYMTRLERERKARD